MIKIMTFMTMALLCLSKAEAYVEINAFSQILSEVDQDTLVLVDLDETCVTTETMLGTSAWWDHFTRKMTSAQFDTKTTFKLVFPLVGKIIQTIPLIPVERETPAIIQALQERNITVWGFTGRVKEAPYDPNFAGTTHYQLQKCNINFEASPLPAGSKLTQKTRPPRFAYGILFSEHHLKGPVLKQFLNDIDFTPAKVVVVDDLAHHLVSIERVLDDMQIPHACFRYNRMDNAPFDSMIANLQLKAMLTQGYIPTDQQGARWKEEMLKAKPGLAADFYLEELIINITQRSSHGPIRS